MFGLDSLEASRTCETLTEAPKACDKDAKTGPAGATEKGALEFLAADGERVGQRARDCKSLRGTGKKILKKKKKLLCEISSLIYKIQTFVFSQKVWRSFD